MNERLKLLACFLLISAPLAAGWWYSTQNPCRNTRFPPIEANTTYDNGNGCVGTCGPDTVPVPTPGRDDVGIECRLERTWAISPAAWLGLTGIVAAFAAGVVLAIAGSRVRPPSLASLAHQR